MFFTLKIFLKNWWISSSLALSLFFNLFGWWKVLFKIRPIGGNIFLHYNILFGVDLVGDWTKILILPIGGLIIILINYSLGLFFYKKEKMISIILGLTALSVQIFLAVSLNLIANLNL